MAQGLNQADLIAVVRINAEGFDAVVELVGDIDEPLRRDGHVARQINLFAAAVAGLAERGDVLEIAGAAADGAEEMNLMTAHVVDVEPGQPVVVRFAGGQECDPQRRAHLGHRARRAVRGQGLVVVVQPAHQGAVQVQYLDFMVAHVGHVDPRAGGALAQAVAVVGDGGGGVELVALLHRFAAEFRGTVLVGEGVEPAGQWRQRTEQQGAGEYRQRGWRYCFHGVSPDFCFSSFCFFPICSKNRPSPDRLRR